MSWLEVGIGPMDSLIKVQKSLKMPEPFPSENGNSIFSPERKKLFSGLYTVDSVKNPVKGIVPYFLI